MVMMILIMNEKQVGTNFESLHYSFVNQAVDALSKPRQTLLNRHM